MRRISLRFGGAPLDMMLCYCLLAGVVAAEEEEKAVVPAEQDSVPEMHSKTRVRFGGMSLGGFYRQDSGYNTYPYYPYPYSPAWWGMSPYGFWPQPDFSPMLYHSGYYRGFSRVDGMGEVKLLTAEKNAEVFLDGAYAGLSEDLKSIWLDPGAYSLELKSTGKQVFKKRIYVLSGKTVKIEVALTPEVGEAKQ